MRSSRLLFLVFITFGIFVLELLSPSKALAEWEDVGSTKYVCVTNKQISSFAASNISLSSVGQQYSGVNTLVSSTATSQYANLTGLSSSTATYLVCPVSGGNIPANKKFRINTETLNMFAIMYPSTTSSSGSITQYLRVHTIRYYVRDAGSWKQVYPQSDGLFKTNTEVQYVALAFGVTEMAQLMGYPRVTIGGCNILIQVPDGEPTVEGYIQDQTEELKSTEGSNNIVDGSQGQQIAQNIGFIQQTGQFVTSAFDAVNNAEASTGLNFPGLTIQGYTIIPAQQVSFLGYLGTDLETQIKNFVTLVLFLAWLMGLRGFYRKMFLGETEVEVVDE